MPRTRYFSVDAEEENSRDAIREAAEILRGGGVVAFPTETVYGLAVLRDDRDAVERLRRIKNRPEGMPLTLHVADPEAVPKHFDGAIPPRARILMDRYWPGPLTLILPDARRGTEGGKTGVRVPSHEVARQLLREAGGAVVATSANPHGGDPATSPDQVREYFDDLVDAAIESGETPLGQASTIVEIGHESFRVLREGIITQDMVHQLLVGKNILFVCTGNSCRSPMAEALFRQRLAERIGTDVDDLRELGYSISSAGIFAAHGGSASANAVDVMKDDFGIDISFHRTRPLTERMIDEADRIYALSGSHLSQIVHLRRDSEAKTRLINENGVVDPVGGDKETYRACANEIDASIRALLETF